MREGNEGIEGQHQTLRLRHRDQPDLLAVDPLAVATLEGAETRAADELRRAAFTCEQHPALLEGLTDRGHTYLASGGVQTLGPHERRRAALDVIARVRLPAGEDERAGRELDAVVALHHEELEPVDPVTHEHDGRREDGGHAFAHGPLRQGESMRPRRYRKSLKRM